MKPSSKDTTPVESTRQAFASRPVARNLKGVGDLAEDLSHITDAEVTINNVYLYAHHTCIQIVTFERRM